MKLIYILSGVLICCCSFSNCDGTDDYSCIDIKDELVTLNPDPVEATNYIDILLGTLPSNPSIADPLGHGENLNLFVERLSQNCDVDATVECYGCIYTLPAQSHVRIQLDSFGTVVSRTLDIRTPEDTVMTLLNIHR